MQLKHTVYTFLPNGRRVLEQAQLITVDATALSIEVGAAVYNVSTHSLTLQLLSYMTFENVAASY